MQAPPSADGSDSIEALVQRAHSGDRKAEATLCQRFLPAIRAFARRRLRTAEGVREFTQDVLVLLLEALRRGAVEEPARFGGFVLGVCRNLAQDRARQRQRRAELFEKYAGELALFASEAPRPGSYEVIHLEDCLSQLSQRARDVIRLAYAEARSHGDIADALGVSEANARVLRHRTLHSLRECLSKRISWEAA